MTDPTGSAQQINLNRPVATNLVDQLFTPSSLHIAVVTYDAQPDLLNDAAAAWGAASTRLAALADTLRKKAAAAADAWSGTKSSVGFQRDIKRLHDTVRGLAEATAGMQRMVESSAQTLTAFKAVFPYKDVSIMGGNDLIDDMMAQLYRFLTDKYAQAIEDHGPTHLTIDYPRVGNMAARDPRSEIPGGDGGSGSGSYGAAGAPGMYPMNSPNGVGAPSVLQSESVPQPDHFSSSPDQFSPPLPDRELSGTLGSGDIDPGGHAAIGTSSGIGAGTGYDSMSPDTALAAYDPQGFGAVSADGLSGGGGVPSSGFAPGYGGSSGPGSQGSVTGFGSSGGGGGRLGSPNPGLGMMPPGGGKPDDESDERTPNSWLPEDTDIWGAKDVEASPAVLGAEESERPRRGRRLRNVADS